MSFARGDLARRAAIADDLALPEPWGANDDERVLAAIRSQRERFRKLGITDEQGRGRVPDFLLDYENLPPKKPVALGRAHTRPSVATRWDQNGNLVETSADTLRLQRDPKTGEPLGLLYEPKRTQILSSPQDITSADWKEVEVTTSDPSSTSKGQSYYEVNETSDGSPAGHFIEQSITNADDRTGAFSAIVKANGITNVAIVQSHTSGSSILYFDISEGAVGTKNVNGTEVDVSIDDLGGGWYRVNSVTIPPAGDNFNNYRLFLVESDGSLSYQGDGNDGIYVMHTQAEVSREVTTPILQGGAVREADTVDYRFDFPDKTTGVAFSIEQQAGNDYSSGFGWGKDATIRMGTAFGEVVRHGALMYRGGLNDDNTDGWKLYSRNSNDDDYDSRHSPLDETIDRLQVDLNRRGNGLGVALIVRQIAIHTEPHTSTQLSDLKSNYLTQP